MRSMDTLIHNYYEFQLQKFAVVICNTSLLELHSQPYTKLLKYLQFVVGGN
jgi:hypothetical protein